MLVSENLKTASEAVISFSNPTREKFRTKYSCRLERATIHGDYVLYMVKSRSHWSGFSNLDRFDEGLITSSWK